MKSRLSIRLRHAGVRRGSRWVLEDVDLDLQPGERWVLTGANGAGKTHLLKLLSTDLWPTATGREQRIFRLGTRRVDEPQAKPLLAYLGAERQDKFARHDWNFTVRDILIAGVQGTDIILKAPTRTQLARVARQLRVCRLTALASRRFLTLSYGQKRLVLLARCLIAQPHWLFLDELYNGLDEGFRRRMNLILEAARRRGQSWMVSAHRPQDIPRGTSKLLRLEKGRVAYSGLLRLAAAGFGLEDAGAPAARGVEVRAAKKASLRKPAAAPPGVAPRTRQRAPLRQQLRPSLIRLRDADLFVESHPVLQGVNWELNRGEHWVVSGGNGAGKSSFLRLLYGDLAPALGGSIERARMVRGTPIEEWKKTVGFVSPELQSDYAIDVSLQDLVISGRYASIGLNEAPSAADVRVARRWLAYFDLADYARHRPRELSYGQMRRALFARVMAGAPRLLLLDEPFTGLDAAQRGSLRAMLSGLMARGITLVMAVHHAEDLPAGITHALRLHKRRAFARALRSANPVVGRRRSVAA